MPPTQFGDVGTASLPQLFIGCNDFRASTKSDAVVAMARPKGGNDVD